MVRWYGLSMLVVGIMVASVSASEVELVRVHLQRVSDQQWRAEVTLRHDDSGWDHYADSWRIIAADGTVLGTRVLLHPHENEQPFTRGLSGVEVPAEVGTIFVEAHDNVHGWSADRIAVDLNTASGPRFTVVP